LIEFLFLTNTAPFIWSVIYWWWKFDKNVHCGL